MKLKSYTVQIDGQRVQFNCRLSHLEARQAVETRLKSGALTEDHPRELLHKSRSSGLTYVEWSWLHYYARPSPSADNSKVNVEASNPTRLATTTQPKDPTPQTSPAPPFKTKQNPKARRRTTHKRVAKCSERRKTKVTTVAIATREDQDAHRTLKQLLSLGKLDNQRAITLANRPLGKLTRDNFDQIHRLIEQAETPRAPAKPKSGHDNTKYKDAGPDLTDYGDGPRPGLSPDDRYKENRRRQKYDGRGD